jgi:hypothetical protein
MKFARFSIGLLIGLIAASAALGQATTFSDVNVDYTFQIPEPKWKMVKSGAAGNVEFVYGDRNDGHLEIRKISSPRATPMADVIKEQEDKLQFMQGYVAGKQENFNGKLNGSVFNFEFLRSGRALSGRYYFIRSGDTIYLLRFTGFQDSLRALRAQTDAIARTFEPKRS